MKPVLCMLASIMVLALTPSGFSMCAINEDWADAPCLDFKPNGKYLQKDVDRWTGYYQYKGSDVMESKYSELERAIKEDGIKVWIGNSDENLNVYLYYFFSGRAPNIGIHDGYFNTIQVIESDGAGGKQKFPNLLPLYSYGAILVIEELLIAGVAGIGIAVFLIWRKKIRGSI